jgi:hypothetical protein
MTFAFVDLDRNDIVRHSLVARIVDAYARDEATKREGPIMLVNLDFDARVGVEGALTEDDCSPSVRPSLRPRT